MPQLKESPRQVLTSPEAFATTLLVLFVDRHGSEGLQWHPQVIREELENEAGGPVPPGNLDKLMAAVNIVTSDEFYSSLDRFLVLCHTLAGNRFDPSVLSLPDAAECAWGITEAMLLSPPDRDEPFCDDIRHYLTEVVGNEGFVRPPDILRLAVGADISDKIQVAFADDPEMSSAIFKTQESKTQDVTGMIRTNLQELLGQLEGLPLQHGDTQNLIQKLRASLHDRH